MSMSQRGKTTSQSVFIKNYALDKWLKVHPIA